jgi:hypothetical protein
MAIEAVVGLGQALAQQFVIALGATLDLPTEDATVHSPLV